MTTNDNEEMRHSVEELVRTMAPDQPEAVIQQTVDITLTQWPLYMALGERDKALKESEKALAAAQYRNTSMDAKTDKTTKTLKADLKDLKGKLTESQEDLARTEKQRDGYENRIHPAWAAVPPVC